MEVGAAVAVRSWLWSQEGAGGWEEGEGQVQEGLDRGARTGVPVLICGEKGTACSVLAGETMYNISGMSVGDFSG